MGITLRAMNRMHGGVAESLDSSVEHAEGLVL